MSQVNSRWVKLYTQEDSQFLVTLTPEENGQVKLSKQIMLHGALHTFISMHSEKDGRDAFEAITRDDVTKALADCENAIPVAETEKEPDMNTRPPITEEEGKELLEGQAFVDSLDAKEAETGATPDLAGAANVNPEPTNEGNHESAEEV